MRTELRVGIFVLIGLSMVGLVIFMIGDTSRLFDSKTTYYATFGDVDGLAAGSSVRMGGVTIGRVSRIAYSDNPKSSDIRLELSVVSYEGRRIRQDSVATIEPKGMLGDKMLAITVGDPTLPAVPARGEIAAGKADGILSRLGEMTTQASNVVGNLEKTTGTLADEGFREDLSESASSIRKLLKALDEGEGSVPRLLHDPAEGEKLSRALTNLERATGRLDAVLAGMQTTIRQINEGPGSAHDLLYGQEATQAVVKIGDAAQQLASTLDGIQSGNGLVKQLLYGGPGSDHGEKVLGDLAAISGDLRVMTSGAREGKGTLGALLVDPSVYEDLKVLLGNVQRNSALRSLVRYSIQQDEKSPSVSNPDGPAQTAATP